MEQMIIPRTRRSDPNHRHRNLVLLGLSTFALFHFPSQAANWPQWRGPYGTGIGDAIDLPTTWGPNENILWKTELPSWSGSSPIVLADRVFVVSPSRHKEAGDEKQDLGSEQHRERGRGRSRAASSDPGGPEILIFCISRIDGSVFWQRRLDSGNQLRLKHNSTSPSPVTDGNAVWSTTGNGVIVALDMDGDEIWRLDLQKKFGKFGMGFGYASSPLLHEGKLFYQVLHGRHTDDPSYIVSIDAPTGQILWKRDRPTDARNESPDAYTTPALLTHEGKDQIVISGADYVTGHDPRTGEECWRSAGLNPRKAANYRIVPSPIVVGGMIYAPTRKIPLLALRPGGTGDITHSHLVWKWDQDGAPDVPTPVCDGKYFYMADDQGHVTCLDAKKGTVIWGPKETGIGSVSASPLLVDDQLYVVGESGETAVVQVGPAFKVIAKNTLDGGYTLSSPAAAGKHLFIRTARYLYCIGK